MAEQREGERWARWWLAQRLAWERTLAELRDAHDGDGRVAIRERPAA